MVSCAYWFVLLSALAVTVFAEDAELSKSNDVEEKWFRNWGVGGLGWGGYATFGGLRFYNGGYFNTYSWVPRYFPLAPYNLFGCAIIRNYPSFWFSKATDTASKDKSRRATLPMVEHINRRDASAAASVCENKEGQKASFQKADCLKAADILVEKKAPSATHGQCTLSLVGTEGKMEAHNVPKNVIQKAVEDILNSCGKEQKAPNAKRSPSEVSKTKASDIALVISKAQ